MPSTGVGGVRPWVFFSLKTQFENAGDALINRELIRLCARHAQIFLDISRCPEDFAKSLDIRRYVPDLRELGSAALFLKIFSGRLRRREIYYFVSPGGYVGEKSGAEAIKLLMNTCLLGFMYLIGVKICHVGVSYERIGKLHARTLAFRSRIMHKVLVRDESSSKYAEGLGITVHGIAPDLAFGSAEYRVPTTGTGLAMSFRVDQAQSQRLNFAEIVRKLDKTLPPSVEFRLVAQVERDIPFIKELGEILASNPNRRVTVLTTFDSVDSSMDAYRGCQYVLSNRLHALLFGMISGCHPVPVVDPNVNAKVIGLFSSIGIETHSVTSHVDTIVRALATDREHYEADAAIVQSQLRLLTDAIASVFIPRRQVI